MTFVRIKRSSKLREHIDKEVNGACPEKLSELREPSELTDLYCITSNPHCIVEIHRQHNETDDYWENWKHRNGLLTDIAAGEVHHASCCHS